MKLINESKRHYFPNLVIVPFTGSFSKKSARSAKFFGTKNFQFAKFFVYFIVIFKKTKMQLLLSSALLISILIISNLQISSCQESGQIKLGGPPDLSDEESSSFHMPERLKCDGCKIIAHMVIFIFIFELFISLRFFLVLRIISPRRKESA